MGREFNLIVNQLRARREGIIIGSIVGAVAANYALSHGFDLSQIVNAGKGLLDLVMSRSAPAEVATYKVYGMFIFAGSAVGALADYAYDNMRVKRSRKKLF